jgi:hypothetical protein
MTTPIEFWRWEDASRIETESGSPVARWREADHAAVLYRTSSYRNAFWLIVNDSLQSRTKKAFDHERQTVA